MISAQPDSLIVSSSTPTAAYIHIPFCRRRCYYCDFPISIVGDRPPLTRQLNLTEGFGTIAEYIEILCNEIRATVALGPPLQTVFFGGGTPSLLTLPQLEQVLDALQQQFGIATGAEISMEIDPDTIDQARLQGYRAAGINRVSLGVQAFQLELLAACGRTHTPADIEAAVEFIHQVGLTNFSFDLISGLPHQTLEHWQTSLEAAIALEPPHISVYDLTIETGTAFARWYQPGVQPLPTEEMTARMYRLAQQMLSEAGYQHYEVSNYAKPGYQCRHNRVYWENQPYYGFGMAAASYTQGQRFTRPRKRREYYQWVQDYMVQGKIHAPVTPPQEALLDTLMLGLRLAEGLNLQTLALQFGQQAVEAILATIAPYVQAGWVELVDAEGRFVSDSALANTLANTAGKHLHLRLSDPDGFLFSNQVLAELFNRL